MTISRKILHMFPNRHPAKQGAECELFSPLSLYVPLPSLSRDVHYWDTLLLCKGCLLFGNNSFISLPFIFSLSCMLLQPKILRLTSHVFKRLAYSWSGQVVWYRAPKGLVPFLVSCLAWVSPQTREFSVLSFKTPWILVLLHVELSVPLWH